MPVKREYQLSGLGCANCAAKIEKGIRRFDWVQSADINFSTSVLVLMIKDGYKGDILSEVEKVVHKYEPQVQVIQREAEGEEQGDSKKELFVIILGAVLFAGGLAAFKIPVLKVSLLLISYAVLGAEILLKSAKNIKGGQFFDENFLMSIASIGALGIGEYPEAAAVMLFYRIGEYFQEAAVESSRRSIKSIVDLRPDFANLKTPEGIIQVSPDKVQVGDLIAVRPGERIPLDGVVYEGRGFIDTSALTGESVPIEAQAGDTVYSGSVNQNSLLVVKVTSVYAESTISKILELVEHAGSKKAPTESFISRFSRYYTPAVVLGAAMIALIPPLFTGNFGAWLFRGLVFLVVSCPCALVISVPMGFFGGIGAASKRGILIKGGNFLEALNNVKTVVFDKTGTLTKGVFEVVGLLPSKGFEKDALLKYAAYAEAFSTHPIAKSIVAEYGEEIDKSLVTEYEEISGHGVTARVFGRSVLIGSDRLMRERNIAFDEYKEPDAHVYVAVDGECMGVIVIADRVKEGVRNTLDGLRALGVKNIAMLTGDNENTAERVGAQLGIDKIYARLMPVDKVAVFESIQEGERGKTAYVGDGINDAPVLARADIGIAMGALGSDAAIEAADIVLMDDEPEKIVRAIKIAARTRRIVWQNIAFALGVKVLVLILGAAGLAGMWEAVFADVGVSVLTVLNSMRVLREPASKNTACRLGGGLCEEV